MGKRIDELAVDDTPLPDPPPGEGAPALDPRQSDWYRFSEVIDDLIATGQVGWAEATLQSIQETVEKTQRVSEGQRRAVDNIEAGTLRGRPRRRYEGYGGRGR